ncbi:similar to stage IV sporulation protein [Paenibacillus sp. UNCCL117]|uniref:sporulation protein YqfD n=1 Tax=unclassified Paenibacillus TaxID=185978 RepID=UPI00088F8D5F|nr:MULTISPECIES: sporulation protein YqfD [unclassified Paenibacillus]SDC72385.1 similar to stage IV sporulation protein [Paenibacillus sp. cl123]SFW24753.1 similar to stage IV sporulation protein [Paenibacillus sp. UNCCL117]
MKQSFIGRLQGFVRVEVTGGRPERLVNLLSEKRMSVWDIRYLDQHRITFHITVRDFFRLRPLLKETGSGLRIRGKEGMPFWLDKLEKRKFFAIGLLGFVIGIYLLSSMVWQVKVEGNETITPERILQAAKEEGIFRTQWKFRLREPSELARGLQSRLPDAAWIGVEVRGTHVIVKVVEARIPVKPPLMNPRHLVASKNALVTDIFAEKGRPLVKPNTYVRKGDILISGLLGDETNTQTVVASGTVKGIVWYKPTVEVPLVRSYKVYTGESKLRSYLVLGSRAVQLTGYGSMPFEQTETIQDRKSLSWRSYVLPIGWLKEKVMEVQIQEHPLEAKEAAAIGLEQAKASILSESGKGSRVISEKILHEKAENGKVYMEVLLEVEEPIAVEQPIVP